MSDRPSASQFWQSVLLRLVGVWLIGWAVVVWFQGCLVPSARDELREHHQKSVPAGPPEPAPGQPRR